MSEKYYFPLILAALFIAFFIIGHAVVSKEVADLEKAMLKKSLKVEHVFRLGETYTLLEAIQSDDITGLERELTKIIDDELFVLLQLGDDEFLEEECIPYRYLRYRRKLEEENLNMKVTELLQQKVKPDSSCKL